ncbi:hypothetical protein B5M42_007710 [Paenibacillus athensensis]|uniref:Uncharacterized protein n=1 Tax=Paenibacillus athensensis TaxID=1967502 RepID=A0A4Y8Q3D3_9BACL|nr:hypothetical protein [Paenibacillus athensensis]MCD1258719.1 hypothetical protein [Paenibacillus athensensis]
MNIQPIIWTAALLAALAPLPVVLQDEPRNAELAASGQNAAAVARTEQAGAGASRAGAGGATGLAERARPAGQHGADERGERERAAAGPERNAQSALHSEESAEPDGSQLTAQEAEKALAEPAATVVNALREKNMQALKPLVHPDRGVRFSPYAFVDVKSDLVFKPSKLDKLMDSSKEYVWGAYDGSGEPIKMTFSQYLNGFVYGRDYAHPEQMAYNTFVHTGSTTNNLRAAYPTAAFVEYNFSRGADGNELGWSSLRLVFEPKGGKWYLVGIINDQWTT